jgi:hypothetical protein
MDWITHELPKASGPYLIAGQMHNGVSMTMFNYVAYFDVDAQRWYKYDPFSKNDVGEEIPNECYNAWKDTDGDFVK